MSSTNKTSHYNLPQFIGSDIPTWLGDINSAMTAIDSGITAAATSASGAATDAAAAQQTADNAAADAAAAQKSADDAMKAATRCPFPVGYGGFFQTDPNSIYAGTTWEQKKDVFILAAGDTYGAGSTGGEAQHKLTVSEMPTHSHMLLKGNAYNEEDHVFEMLKATKGDHLAWATEKNDDKYYWQSYTEPGGGSQPHNNMPPYYTMPFWIRTA